MALWLAYVPTGYEFALVEDCAAIGITAIVPRKVEAVRAGEKRRPGPRVIPYMPNYGFIDATIEQWHWLKDIKYIRDIMGIAPQWRSRLQMFFDSVENEFSARMAEIDNAQRIMQSADATKEARREAVRMMQSHTPGDWLEIISGPLAGQIVAFSAMVERANAATPEIEAEMAGIKIRIDPLVVRRAV
jgi:transcription antitermination factor NusG